MTSNILKYAFDRGRNKLEEAINETTIKLAVTGLSRSGKTVFMTSMIQNLLALGDNVEGALPELSKKLQNENEKTRLKSVKIIPADVQKISLFDFESKISLLKMEKPEWPHPTDDISITSLILEVERSAGGALSVLKKNLPNVRIKIDILDYPGEWLLDLPLLSQSYEEWSQSTLKLMNEEPRSKCFEKFRNYVKVSNLTSDKKSETSEAFIKEAHQLYKKGLLECRLKYGLQYLQPGRFICPGPKGSDLPLLWFFPIESSEVSAKDGSILDLLKRRFEAYKKYVCQEFFDGYFDGFNRQILLVDVLTALHQGRTIFADTQKAIEEISKGISNRQGLNLSKIPSKIVKGIPISGKKIEKIVVAATKSDHAPPISRNNMSFLVNDMVGARVKEIFKDNISFHAIASVESTEPSTANFEDKEIEVVVGKVDGKIRPYNIGQIPSRIPGENYFNHKFFSLPVFEPKPFDPRAKYIKNIDLDKVLSYIIGDQI